MLQLRQVRTEINSNPQSTDRLKSCIQDALQNMQARHKTATANPVSKQPCWDKLYNASCSEVSKQMSVWYVLQSQPTLHCVNHPISCADRTRQWRCTKHLWITKHSVHALSALGSPVLSALTFMSPMYSSGRPQDSKIGSRAFASWCTVLTLFCHDGDAN